MSEIGPVEGACEAYTCFNDTIEKEMVDQDLDTIANLVVRLRSEAQQTHEASKITDLEAVDKVLRALAEHFNALSPFEKKPYYDLFAVFQETGLMHIDPLGDDRTLYYNGENRTKGEWEALINTLFMQYTDGTWYKGKQLEDFLEALKPYGMHFDPPECKGIDPTTVINNLQFPAEPVHEKEMEDGFKFFNQMMKGYAEDPNKFLTTCFDDWIVKVSNALDAAASAYNASKPFEKESFKDCVNALIGAGILEIAFPQGILSRSWSSNIEKPKMLFGKGRMYHIDTISGDLCWNDRFMIMMGALAKRVPV